VGPVNIVELNVGLDFELIGDLSRPNRVGGDDMHVEGHRERIEVT
jgi:hypothetical protein